MNRRNNLTIKTYKSIWDLDLNSGIASVKSRKRYPLQFFSKMHRKLRILGKDTKIENDPSLIYESTDDYAGGQQNFCSVDDINVQAHRADIFCEILKGYNISLLNQSILDISGGSGVFVKRLLNHGAKEVMNTEFSKLAVQYSRSQLGIPAVHYDINKDKLVDLTNGKKFDVILLRGCIEFCDDLDQLSKDLSEVTHENSIVILTFIHPTLGVALRTSFDQYNVKYCRPSSSVASYFENNGYISLVNSEIFLFDRNYAFAHLKWPFFPFYVFYLIKALWKLKQYNYPLDFHALDSKCPLLILKRV